MKVLEMSAERINKTLTTNVTTAVFCCREAVRRMAPGGAYRQYLLRRRAWAPWESMRDYAASQGAVVNADRRAVSGVRQPGSGQRCVRFIYTDM